MQSLNIDADPIALAHRALLEMSDSRGQDAYDVVGEIVASQLRSQLEDLAKSLGLRRFTVRRRCLRSHLDPPAPSLRDVIEAEAFDLGEFTITLVTPLESEVSFTVADSNAIDWTSAQPFAVHELKTIRKHVLRSDGLLLRTRELRAALVEPIASCRCSEGSLVPNIDHVWDWVVQFTCGICGKQYICSCFRPAMEAELPRALGLAPSYAKHGWPHRFLRKYGESTFREGICHLCSGRASDLFFCHPMYGSRIMVRYGAYVVRTEKEFDIDRREAENRVRDQLGVAHIGEAWISEVELLRIVRTIYPDREVLHQASPDWLGLQRFDVYIPSLSLAIEYQGRQHYEPIEHFGGQEAYERTCARDQMKASLCESNGVRLLYFRYDEDVTEKLVRKRIAQAIRADKGGTPPN